jgi:hypothetical protein
VTYAIATIDDGDSNLLHLPTGAGDVTHKERKP